MQKFLKIKYARAMSQIIFLILYPGLFALSFSEIGNVYSMIIHKTGNIYIQAMTILTALVLLILTATLGRFFCGWICTFGAMNDLLFYLNKKIFKNKFKFKIDKDLDFILKKLKYFILFFIIIFFWTLGEKLQFNTNPWTSFANIVSMHPTMPSISIGLLFLIIIVIGAFFIERFFCRYLCPLGAIFAITSKLKFVHITKPRSECGKCSACSIKCSMGLKLYEVDKVTDGDCINCFKCVAVCPKKNANVSIAKRAINAMLVALISLLSFFALYNIKKPISKALNKQLISSMTINPKTTNVSNTTTNTDANSTTKSPSANSNLTFVNKSNSSTTKSSNSTAKYIPGTYTGQAFGHSSEIHVSVKVDANKIDSVIVTQINDTPGYYEQPCEIIPQEILTNQSTNVDVVSGATYSSTGIINAVKKALSKATKQ